MDMNEATAKAIGAERAISGITVRELSKRTGIPMSSLMRVLQAEREIKVNQVAKIAAAFELYPHEIIEHAERLLERSGPRAPIPLPEASMSDPYLKLVANDENPLDEQEGSGEDR